MLWASYLKTPMNKVHQFGIQISNQIWIQTKEKKNKTEKGKRKGEGPQLARPARPASAQQQPASLACARSSRPAQLARPAQQAA